jgi:hypothetical protein
MLCKQAPVGSLFALCLEAAVAVSTQARKKQNPDDARASVVIVVCKDSVTTAVVRAAAAKQKQDNPNVIATGTSKDTIISSAITCAATVCSGQIAHNLPPRSYLWFILCNMACRVSQFKYRIIF